MITYLLGAGASADCVPIVEKFHDTYKSIINIQLIQDDRLRLTLTQLSDNYRTNLHGYYTYLEGHPTIDILAKKYFLKREYSNLLELKKWLIVFYNFIQYSKPIDERYVKFFASILQTNKSENIIPEGINIITWNYDMQLELAYSDFIKKEEEEEEEEEEDNQLEKIHKSLRIYPSPFYDYRKYEENNKFTITHLNGSACLGYVSDTKGIDILFKPNFINFRELSSIESKVWTINEKILETIARYERTFDINYKSNRIYQDFTYCWENNDIATKSHNRAISMVRNTTDLIIIGYSFPYVNREVDDKIFRNLSSIKRIIIQNPMEDEKFRFIDNRIRELLRPKHGSFADKIPILQRRDTSEFYIP